MKLGWLANSQSDSQRIANPQSVREFVKLTSMDDPQWLVLRAWEAVSRERHLQGVLEAVTEVLLPHVPFATIGIIALEGERHDLYAMHVVGAPHREGETLQEFFRRTESYRPPPIQVPSRPLIPYPDRTAKLPAGWPPYVCDDLLAKDAWYEHEFVLASCGVRSYCSLPLLVSGEPIGAASFLRLELNPFMPEQVSVLSRTAPALAVAVKNALANEQIRKLRDQLEAENTALKHMLGQTPWFDEIVGKSPPVRRVLDAVEQVAETDATVLITGETGTGKELIARAIHRRSPRAQGPLIKVNCGAIPETLLASELFGHERGAFTGASERRKGRFEQAHGGTLFLDEIGEMPPETQVMLLRVLQEREFERVGGSQTVRVDVRIVAATNCDLAGLVREGRFRGDLFYRLNVFPVHLPPLRERIEDIPPLVAHFARRHGERFKRSISRIDAPALDALRSHDWPGNVRELENVVERAVILSHGGVLRVGRELLGAPAAPKPDMNMSGKLKAQERESIEAALEKSRGRVSGKGGAAERLGLPASTLEFRIKRLGIDKFRARARAAS